MEKRVDLACRHTNDAGGSGRSERDGTVLAASTLRAVSNDAVLCDPIAIARAIFKNGSLVAAGEETRSWTGERVTGALKHTRTRFVHFSEG